MKNTLVSRRNVSLILFVLIFPVLASPAFASVRFDVVGSPTEVINTGRAEVLGSISLIVRGSGNSTGTSTGGATQIGFLFSRPALQIDNTVGSGILLFFSPGFAPAAPALTGIENRVIGGECMGFFTLNLLPGAVLSDGDYIRIEGIRGRIDASAAVVPDADLFVDLQSINDPAATSLSPDRVRVAKSFQAMTAEIVSGGFGLRIRVTEGFARAFVDMDANDDGINSNDRTDSASEALGAPTNSTQVHIRLDDVPGGVAGVIWPVAVPAYPATGALLRLLESEFETGTSEAVYSFEALDQTGGSDIAMESFTIVPSFDFAVGDCNAEMPGVRVSLAPAVPRSSACDVPSADEARPRFLESDALMVDRLDPSSAIVGGPAFVLKVRGAGFVAASTVRWDGIDVPTLYLSGTQLEATIPEDRLLRAGAVTVTVANPADAGGSVSNPSIFTISPHALSLYFPRLEGTEPGSGDSTGIALVNLSGRTAALTLTAFGANGIPIAGSGIQNPAVLTLTAWQQLSLVGSEIFGAGLQNAGTPAWVRLEGDVPRVPGFFLAFNESLTSLDGTDTSGTALTSFVLPEAGGGTWISISNPNIDPATVTIRLVNSGGVVRDSVIRRIEAHGVLSARVKEIFPGATPDPSDYLRADSDAAVVPFESFGPAGGDVAALNGQDAGAGSWKVYSPQYVVGGPDWQSTLTVVNLDADPGTVRFRLVADDGSQIGSTRELPIAAQGKLLVTAQDFFLDPGTAVVQGYVEISGIGIRVSGSVVFGSPVPGKLLASLPLGAANQTRLLFSQIASDQDFYTGLAVLNPGGEPVSVSIQVYDNTGAVIARKVEDLPARGRVSKVLTEYFPELSGKKISEGYVIVEAIQNLSAFALFGTKNLAALAAVPPHIF